MKKLFLLALMIPTVASAAVSGYVTLSRVGQQSDGTIILYANGGWGSVANNSCSNGTGVLAFDSSTTGGKAMLTAAMLAFTAQKTVTVSTSDSTCLAVGGLAPAVLRLDVIN